MFFLNDVNTAEFGRGLDKKKRRMKITLGNSKKPGVTVRTKPNFLRDTLSSAKMGAGVGTGLLLASSIFNRKLPSLGYAGGMLTKGVAIGGGAGAVGSGVGYGVRKYRKKKEGTVTRKGSRIIINQ